MRTVRDQRRHQVQNALERKKQNSSFESVRHSIPIPSPHASQNINKRHCSSSLFIFSRIIYFEKKNISFFCRFPYFSFLAGYHVEDYYHCFFIIIVSLLSLPFLFCFFFHLKMENNGSVLDQRRGRYLRTRRLFSMEI